MVFLIIDLIFDFHFLMLGMVTILDKTKVESVQFG